MNTIVKISEKEELDALTAREITDASPEKRRLLAAFLEGIRFNQLMNAGKTA